MDYWSGVFGNIVASLIGALIGALAGYYGGVKLFRRQLREDELIKRTSTIYSLLKELREHQNILDEKRTFGSQREIIEEDVGRVAFQTSSFESIVSAGCFSLLSPEAQNLTSKYYYYCKLHNRALEQLSIDYTTGGKVIDIAPINMSWKRPERCFSLVVNVRASIFDNVNKVIQKLESER